MYLTAIVIDDELPARELISKYAQKVNFLEIRATFNSAKKGEDWLRVNNVDLIFLDVNMPGKSGIEFISTLEQRPMIIFTTAYSEYAINGFALDVLDFLLKPFSEVSFMKSCRKALEQKLSYIHKETTVEIVPEFLFISTKGSGMARVVLNDILYVEAIKDNYRNIVTKNQNFLIRKSLEDFEKVLPKSKFLRINRSCIIAIDKVDTMIWRQELSIAGTRFSIGDSYEKEVSNVLAKFKLD